METNGVKVVIITTPIVKASITPLTNLVNIFGNFAEVIFVVSGNEFMKAIRRIKIAVKEKLRVSLTYYDYNLRGLSKALNHLFLQVKYVINILKIAKKADLFVFTLGGTVLILPVLICKLLDKKIIIFLTGSSSKASRSRGSPLWQLLYILERICLLLSDYVIVYSKNLVREWNLEKYSRKIIFAHEHFLDFSKFSIKTDIRERKNVIGFIGRLEREKGILNFVYAIPLILKRENDVRFVICGEGELADTIRKKLINKGELKHFVKLKPWVSHENVPSVLNRLKLLVLPSYTEGLPNILLEAMACGTPVLATTVGAIPDIIKEGITGFLLKSNEPEHIASRIIELLDKPELLENVSINAYNYVRENFSYEKTLKTWQKILSEFNQVNDD